MNQKSFLKLFLTAASLLGALSPDSSHGQVLNPIFTENFNYALADGTNLNGVAFTGTGGQGSYITSADSAPYTAADYTTTALGSGFNYITQGGGSLSITANAFSTASVQLNATSASSSVYGSFLFNTANLGGNVPEAEWVEISSAAGAHDNSNEYYGAEPYKYLDPQSQPILQGQGAYSSNANTGLTAAATTYLDLFYVTGLGTTTESATQWILTASQYNTLLAANGNKLTLAILTGAASSSFTSVATVSSTTSNPTLDATQFLTIGVYNSYGTSNTLLVSNIQLGTQGFSVPEPGMVPLLGIGLVALLGLRLVGLLESRSPARA